MNTLFIIDKTADIKTQARDYGTMTAPEGHTPTRVDYSGSLYNNKGENFTLDQYKDYKQNPNLVAITWDEFYKITQQFELTLQGDWTEETEKEYYNALECLPPGNWHNLDDRLNSFYIIEALTGSLHSHHIADRQTGKFYTATRSKFITDAELIAQLNNI